MQRNGDSKSLFMSSGSFKDLPRRSVSNFNAFTSPKFNDTRRSNKSFLDRDVSQSRASFKKPAFRDLMDSDICEDNNPDNESLAGPVKSHFLMKLKHDADNQPANKPVAAKSKILMKGRLATNIASNGLQY